MNIRKAMPQDAHAIYALHLASIRSQCSSHYSPEQIDGWTSALAPERYLEGMKLFDFFLAEEDKTLLGLCIVNTAGAELNALYISPDASGRGVGRTLYEAAEQLVKAANASTLIVKATLNAVPFYERCGFVVIGNSVHALPSGRQLPCVEMHKQL